MIDNRHRGSRFCALTSVLLAWFLGLHSAVAEDADGLRVTDYFISHTSTEPFYAEQKLDPSVTLHVREVVLAGRERTVDQDGKVLLFNPDNGGVLKSLEDHKSWVQGVTFFGAGTRLVTVGADRTVRVWGLKQ